MTPARIKALFRREGKTVAAWARERGYKTAAVYAVLNGQNKGRFGISHQIAVDLGIKVTGTDDPAGDHHNNPGSIQPVNSHPAD